MTLAGNTKSIFEGRDRGESRHWQGGWGRKTSRVGQTNINTFLIVVIYPAGETETSNEAELQVSSSGVESTTQWFPIRVKVTEPIIHLNLIKK